MFLPWPEVITPRYPRRVVFRAHRGQQAYVICSVAVDLRISNVVDVPNYVVSALLPEAIFDNA
jgi:acetamidase/formamidase